MSEPIKIALIAAAALVASVCLYMYFSPYQSCVRGLATAGTDEKSAHFECARQLGGSGK
jgi:hypothetical protein